MRTPLPKVVHPVAGRPMIERVFKAVKESGSGEVRVVVGFGEHLVRQIVEPLGGICYKQDRQAGTGDAVRSADPATLQGDVVILNGDHPLMEAADIAKFHEQFRDSGAGLAVVTCELVEPGNFGRIVRRQDRVVAIVEAKDASHDTLRIREINTGIFVVKADVLNRLLPQIQNGNKQNEFYLTDIVGLAIDSGIKVEGIRADARVALGVNTQMDLAAATREVFARKARRLMESGVIMLDPATAFVEDTVEVEPGAVIYPNVFLRGRTKVGAMTVIEPGCVITDGKIGVGVHLKAGCYVTEAGVGDQVQIGPYAHLRPGTELGEGAHVGNFVEMKKVKFGKGAKANHLTYLGDAEVGENTNIGCGTITCNYAADRKKYVTKIGNDCFIGSDTQFIAPVTVGDGAYVGSGSTITKDVPSGALAVSRSKQVIRENYVPRSPDQERKKD